MQTSIESILLIEYQFPMVLATLVQSYDPTQLILDGIYLRYLWLFDCTYNTTCKGQNATDLIQLVKEYAFMHSQLHRIIREIVKKETLDELALQGSDVDIPDVNINRITIEVSESQEDQLIEYFNKALDYTKLTKMSDRPVCEYSLTYKFQLGRTSYPLILVGPVTVKSLYNFVKDVYKQNFGEAYVLRSIEIDPICTLQLHFGPRKLSHCASTQEECSFRVIFASAKSKESSSSKDSDNSNNSDSTDGDYDEDEDSTSDGDCEIPIAFDKGGYCIPPINQ